jgi:PAS domain S-box-containing protein
MRPWYADDGSIGGALLFSEVITEAVMAKRAIESQERRLRIARDAARLGSWEADLVRRVPVEWSARARELIGVDADAIPSLDVLVERIHPDDREAFTAALAHAEASSEGHHHAEFRVVLPDGNVRWLDDCGQIEFDEDHQPNRAIGVVRDVSDVKRQERRQQLLINELNHRVKNTLATVQAIAMQSLRKDEGADAAGAFIARLKALAGGHDVLAQEHWEGAPLADVVARAIAPHNVHDRIVERGPHVWLPPRHALAMTLALHELCTNAAKYGALSNADGLVEISWVVLADGFRLQWRERNGPPVSPPTRFGFGSRLLQRALGSDLDGAIHLNFNPSGVLCVIEAKVPKSPPPAIDEEGAALIERGAP